MRWKPDPGQPHGSLFSAYTYRTHQSTAEWLDKGGPMVRSTCTVHYGADIGRNPDTHYLLVDTVVFTEDDGERIHIAKMTPLQVPHPPKWGAGPREYMQYDVTTILGMASDVLRSQLEGTS